MRRRSKEILSDPQHTHVAKSWISPTTNWDAISGSLNFRITSIVRSMCALRRRAQLHGYELRNTSNATPTIHKHLLVARFRLFYDHRENPYNTFIFLFPSFSLSRFYMIHVGQPCNTQWRKTRARVWCERKSIGPFNPLVWWKKRRRVPESSFVVYFLSVNC